jgi:L-2,4-diaminobutyric acid acetyltransferase
MTTTIKSRTMQNIKLRKPVAEDGAAVWELIGACRPLDENSMYCNMLQCDHFRDTCVIAESGDRVVGWVSGYLVPGDDSTLFIWQVAVSDHARGAGLAGRMLQAIVTRDICRNVAQIQTTITRDNAASWALFQKFAERQNADLDSAPHFTRDDHFDGAHATEHMVTIALPEALRKAA